MMRALVYTIISIVAITFLRMVMGLITKGIGDLMKEETASTSGSASSRPAASGKTPTAGELKPCARCGTYVLASSAISSKDAKAFYCSEACRDK
ncbi:MAG: hypothetical protein HYZ37_03170 [Candidatus Solibacter usitatus]|nr:hypothetical protein [Candidatus Solibacter usitatus]